MPKLKNLTRAPLVVATPSLGTETFQHVRIGRDPTTGAHGRIESEQKAPKTIFLPGRGMSDELPESVLSDPEVHEALTASPPRIAIVPTTTSKTPKEP